MNHTSPLESMNALWTMLRRTHAKESARKSRRLEPAGRNPRIIPPQRHDPQNPVRREIGNLYGAHRGARLGHRPDVKPKSDGPKFLTSRLHASWISFAPPDACNAYTTMVYDMHMRTNINIDERL